MTYPVEEWVEKAEEDYQVVLALRRSRRHPARNAICFHAQQCVEKYLKALIEKQGTVVRKIHALPLLLDECLAVYPILSALRPGMLKLSEYAVEFRYPGESATAGEATKSVRIMNACRGELRATLGLPFSSTRRRKRRGRL